MPLAAHTAVAASIERLPPSILMDYSCLDITTKKLSDTYSRITLNYAQVAESMYNDIISLSDHDSEESFSLVPMAFGTQLGPSTNPTEE